MPKDKNRPHPTPDDLRHRFEDLAARFAEKSRPAPGASASPPPADDYGLIWKSLQDLFTRDVTAREFQDLVGRESEDTLRFFTREIDFSGLEHKPWFTRYPAAAWKIFLAMAFRLSPARRVVFALAVLVIIGAWLRYLLTQVTTPFWFSIPISLVAGTLLLALLVVELRDKLALKGDLEIARQIQFGLLPFAPFSRDGTSIYAAMRPANTVGGDYFDIIDLPDGRIALAMADVAGKGIPAALLMALLQGSLRTLITAGFRGPALVRTLNDHLCANIPRNRLVTVFYAEFDPATGVFHYVNAGHNAPLLLRPTGATRLGTTGMALGVMGGSPFEERGETLAAGERLFLFTDGVTEAFDPQDREYGDERLESLLLSSHALRSPDLLDAVRDDVLAFCGSARPRDDMTMMVVERS
jgi:phosphoserine phosphatase RsbU/P